MSLLKICVIKLEMVVNVYIKKTIVIKRTEKLLL